MYSLKIQNWIFFIPTSYLLLVLVLGIIYSVTKDNIDYRFLQEHDDVTEESPVVKESKDRENIVGLN